MGHLLLEESAGTSGEISWRRNGEGMQRSALATVVGRARMACPAARCRREHRLGTGGRQVKRREGESFFFFFFLSVPSVCYLLLCAHPERKDGHCAPVSSARMDARCHSLLPSQRTGGLTLPIGVESPKMTLRGIVLWIGLRGRGRSVGALRRVTSA